MALIDLSNYDSLLAQSTAGRATFPNGTTFFDTTNGIMELITAEEQAYVNLTNADTPTGSADVAATAMVDGNYYMIKTLGTTTFADHGATGENVGEVFQYDDTTPGAGTGTVDDCTANPLIEDDGIKLEALYAFERQERRKDETLRQYDYFLEGTFKFGGAYKFVNNRKLYDSDSGGADSLTGDDRYKIRGSGWEELDADGELCRIYYGNKSLGTIEALSVPYYQLSGSVSPDTNTITPVPYDKDGPIDEAVQVFGDVTYDTNTTTFDTRVYESLKVRTYGYNYDEKILADSGVVEMGGYNTGFAISETVHLTTNTTSHPLASVYNATPASQLGVWEDMTLEELDTAQTETGFTTADADFTWVLNNVNAADLDECIAYLDAIAQVDADINAHASNTTYGQRVGTWYTYNAAGKILPRVGTGAAGEGLFIEGLTGTDKNRVIFTDDAGSTKEYPFYLSVAVNVGAGAVADTNAWFHAFYLDGPGAGDDFNAAGALTVEDADATTEIKGNVNGSGLRTGNIINFEYNFDSDPISGGGEFDVVFECEGDGGVTAAKTVFTLTDPATAASITASCVPGVENNV